MASDGKSPELERLVLIKTLNRLPDVQFNELVYALNSPPGVIPPPSAPQGDRAPKLLRWAENSNVGPGLAKLQEVLDRVLGKEPESTSPPPDAAFTEDLENGVTFEMIHIPAGRFWMGSPKSEEDREDCEAPRHRVSVSAFLMGKYLVTQRQWHAVSLMDAVDMPLESDPSYFKGDNRPVESVSWDDAIEFCARLSMHNRKVYRLPSEAEWEYACRAGTIIPYHFGKAISKGLSNYDRHNHGTTEVGKFPANAFGLYDMHGNVWEWCLDHWHENYEGAPTDGSAWIEGGDLSRRPLRGGSWFDVPDVCRSAFRFGDMRVNRGCFVGFRIVCAFSWTL